MSLPVRCSTLLLVLGCACSPTGHIGSVTESANGVSAANPSASHPSAQPDDGTLAARQGAPDTGAQETTLTPGETTPTAETEPSAVTPQCAGVRSGAGIENRSVTVDGTLRSFLLYTPASLAPDRALPLVFVHHGFTMSGAVMRDLTALEKLADQEGFLIAFPDGTAVTPWNVGANICGLGAAVNSPANDFGFFEKMIEDIARDHCVDRARVFVTGFSMGGYFTNHVACKHPEWVRAAAPHSGGTYPEEGCGSAPKPVLILHGTSDMVISYQCGVEARDKWVKHNGCTMDADKVQVQGGVCEWYQGCRPGGQVVFCTFQNMGHGWSGGLGLYGGGTQFEGASQLVWDFFKKS